MRLSATLAAGLLILGACARPASPGPPNVLLLSIDSLRRNHVSALGRVNPSGRDTPTTPAFERLARTGVLFENAVSTTSWTLPAHMALFTGLPDDLHGVTDNQLRLADGIETLAGLLGKHGYATGGFFSGPNLHPAFGFSRGFDTYRNCSDVRTDLASFESREVGDLRATHLRSHAAVTSPRLLRESWDWIEERVETGEPFFAFVHWWDPHYDYLAPAEYEALYDDGYTGPIRGHHQTEKTATLTPPDLRHLKNLYDAEIRYTDDHVSRLLDRLEALGALDNTIVILTSDHGEEFYEHGRWGHQRTLNEEVVRIPLAISWPGHVPAAVRPRGQAPLQDILPTICDLLDIAPPEYLEDASLAALWEAPNRAGPLQVLRLRIPYREIDITAVRGSGWKFTWDHATGHGQLYRLEGATDQRLTQTIEEPEHSKLPRVVRAMAAIEALEARRALLPARNAASLDTLPPGLSAQLEAMGYLGE